MRSLLIFPVENISVLIFYLFNVTRDYKFVRNLLICCFLVWKQLEIMGLTNWMDLFGSSPRGKNLLYCLPGSFEEVPYWLLLFLILLSFSTFDWKFLKRNQFSWMNWVSRAMNHHVVKCKMDVVFSSYSTVGVFLISFSHFLPQASVVSSGLLTQCFSD